MSVVPQDLISKHSLTMNLVSEHYNKQDVLSELQQEFGQNDYVKLPGLIASQAFKDQFGAATHQEIFQFLENKSVHIWD